MSTEHIDALQEIYAKITRIIKEISVSPCKDDIDDQSINRLKDAQDCIMDAVMVAVEHSFSNGNLAIEEL